MAETSPPVVVVMGVAGVGKSTVAQALAQRLGAPCAEGDDFHPDANIAKMSAGIPLDDSDRWPWLQRIAVWMSERGREGSGAVVTCSALKRSYRDVLRAGYPAAFFVHLSGGRALIGDRMSHRAGHFMPTSLLDSQFEILEPLQPDENGVVLDVGIGPEELVAEALRQLGA
ncbi:Thermoresistant gluconokinase [Mycobacteroides salmoniphilum]|uniref:Gluconokinase n=1 Tax=Mycobacteroides salmoniphilum TaxID=404941 RepID=A0A4R8S1N5_9MYCO|nr:gluconokinase [Mycobacteroides salmoniphilum]TDZ83112.1 Thermoresistant gluconokinase [Mycobacteroides salmoniphilum]